MSVSLRKTTDAPQSGYTHCACRDCMDIAMSSDTSKPELCLNCEGAGCMAWPGETGTARVHPHYFECQREDAYGADDDTRCEGHYDDDATLMSGVGIGEPTFCDGSCNG